MDEQVRRAQQATILVQNNDQNQNLNALVEGVIVADHTCLCSSGTNCDNSRNYNNAACAVQSSIILSNTIDNNNDIHLPSILLEKQDADAIIQQQQQSSEQIIQAELSWNVAPVQTDSTVTLDYWHVPSFYKQQPEESSLMGFEFVLNHILGVQGQVVVGMTPKYYIVPGEDIGCDPATVATNSLCSLHCTHFGRYCAEDPEASRNNNNNNNNAIAVATGEGSSGAQVVEEILRRMCIWSLYGTTSPQTWWAYMAAYEQTCVMDDTVTDNNVNLQQQYELLQGDACSRTAMETAGVGVDYMTVSRCVFNAGREDLDQENILLEAALLEQREKGIPPSSPIPTVVVNGIPYRAKTASETFGAICASFITATMPNICRQCAGCGDEYDCLQNNGICAFLPEEIELPLLPPPTTSPLVQVPTIGDIAPTSSPTALNVDSPTPIDEDGEEAQAGDNEIVPPSANGEGDPNETSSNATSPGSDEDTTDEDGGNGADNDKNDEGGGGLDDQTKVVIVVSVVGGAIVVIFTVVMFLVWKLFMRIRRLETKEKHTPTTTSPAGSGIWELPTYVTGKEDPFNSEFEQLPDGGDGGEPIPNDVEGVEAAIPVQEVSIANYGVEGVLPVVSRADTIEDDKPSQNSPTQQPLTEPATDAPKILETDGQNNNFPPTASLVEEVLKSEKKTSENAAPTVDQNKPSDEGQVSRKNSKNKEEEEKGKVKGSGSLPGKPKSKRRKSKNDSILINQIMGKAAPEGRIPKRFSYEDEEKSEIESEIESIEVDSMHNIQPV